MKRIIALFLVISALLSIVSCGEYRPPVDNVPGGNGGNGSGNNYPGGSTDQPALDNDPTNDFTVQLRLNDQPFAPGVSINEIGRAHV